MYHLVQIFLLAPLASITMRTIETPRNKGVVLAISLTSKQQKNPNIVIRNRNIPILIMKLLYSTFFNYFPHHLQREKTLAHLCLLYRLMWSGLSLPIWPRFSWSLPASAFYGNLLFNNITTLPHPLVTPSSHKPPCSSCSVLADK